MKLKLLLIIGLSISLTACGWGRNNNNAEIDDLETAITDQSNDLLAAQQPQITPPIVTPLPLRQSDPFANQQPLTNQPSNFAPLPQPVVTAPITPTPQINVGTQEALRAEAGDRIFFQTNASQLDGRAQAILSSVAAWMGQNPQRNLSIEGHADERGTREYNLALGERRATAVKNYLVAQGISPSRLNAMSFGKERPAAGGSNPRSWALNRRSVFIVR